MREVGYRRAEGAFLSNLGDLLAKLGRMGEAREALEKGEALLRAVDDKLALGKLLCIRGRVELNQGMNSFARAALVEAERLAVETVAGPDSELGREIITLRMALDHVRS